MKLDYSSWKNNQSNSGSNENNSKIGYFNLRDGEETLIRIMHEDVSKVDVVACHWIEYNGRNMMVNCPRNPQDPVDKCPCCAEGTPLMYRAFIRVLEYMRDDRGVIQAVPKVWNRPASFIKILIDKEADWGPLCDVVCKVRRYGNSSNTTFDVQPLPTDKYPVSTYIKDNSAFEGYDPVGHSVMNMPNAMLNKGQTTPSDSGTTKPTYNTATPAKVETVQDVATPRYSTPVESTVVPRAVSTPAQDTTAPNVSGDGFGRPRRFY